MTHNMQPERDFPDEAPTWDDHILGYFTKPYWVIPESRSIEVARGWVSAMSGYFIQLDNYDSVKTWSVLIYQHLHSRSMPLTSDPTQMWPDAAMETFRVWVNQGWRKTADDPIDRGDRIPQPTPSPRPLRLRRDILSLSEAELNDYRMRLEDVFQVENAAPTAPGQIFFAIHGNWCLHYQEAFLFWHRAYLMAFEQQLGCGVPYWNWYAEDAAIEGSPSAGLPQAFKDETYVRPDTGATRPNPLRFAAAMGGVSKACVPVSDPPSSASCYWVQRDPILYTSGDDQRAARAKKYGLTRQYQLQVQKALAFSQFSHPQGIGYPWANIPTFSPPPPDSDYVYRNYNFDGAYEQPHDNYHGWVGPDMADNAYTAFDPVFWSYHANIDRIFELWLRDNSTNTTFSAPFPLRPFAGPLAEGLEFTDPRAFVYTTIGDLAKDCRALGYDYGAPAYPDFGTESTGQSSVSRSRMAVFDAAKRLTPATVPEDELLIVFNDVRCTLDSYAIDAFLDLEEPTLADVDPANDHYVGRFTRIGMGMADDKGRCITVGVPRILDATETARRLGIAPGDAAKLTLLVTNLSTGMTVSPADHGALPGFAGRLYWSKAGVVTGLASLPAAAKGGCCH